MGCKIGLNSFPLISLGQKATPIQYFSLQVVAVTGTEQEVCGRGITLEQLKNIFLTLNHGDVTTIKADKSSVEQ